MARYNGGREVQNCEDHEVTSPSNSARNVPIRLFRADASTIVRWMRIKCSASIPASRTKYTSQQPSPLFALFRVHRLRPAVDHEAWLEYESVSVRLPPTLSSSPNGFFIFLISNSPLFLVPCPSTESRIVTDSKSDSTFVPIPVLPVCCILSGFG